MRKIYLFMLMAVGLLISTTMWAGPAKVALAREAKPDMPQVEKQQVAEPQPFAMVAAQDNSMRKAPKKAALSTEAITNDQVTLEVNGVKEGTTYSIVDAFKYVNTQCSATDSAVITLQKNIDLAKEDYYSTGNAFYGVVLDANRKAVLDLNGFNFKSAIQTGSASGNNDGKNSALICNKGILYLTDHTFDYAIIKNADPATVSFDASSLCFFDESASVDPQNPGYASNVVLNQGDLTIRGCKLSDTSYGPACYCVDHYTCSRDSITLWVEGGFISGKYSAAVRQCFTNSTCRSKFVMNDGIFYAGETTCVWTQFNKNVDPKCEVYFSGGKCLAPNYYAYYNYPHGNNSTKDCSYNFSGTEFNSKNGNFIYGGSKDKEGEGTTINIYGGKNIGDYSYCFSTHHATINVYDGTFDAWYFYSDGHHNTFNIMGGEFNNSYIYETDYYKPSDGTKNIWNISNGKFNASYIYLSNVKGSTYNISGGVFTDSYSIYALSTVSNCTFNLSDGTFGGDIADYGNNNNINVTGGLYRSDIYKGTSSTSTIDITGGYYAYGRMAHNKAYDDCDMYWTNYIHEGYVDIINGTGAEDMQPWVSDDKYNYFYKVGLENKTHADIDENGKIVVPDGEGGTRDPEPTDNIIITNDNPEGEGEYGRDTMYLDKLNVNGITFAGRDTIDVIAKPGSVVIVGSSGIKASDTTTVYMTVEGGGSMKVGVEAIQKVDTVIVKSDANGNGTLLISPNAQLTDEEKLATVKLYVDGACKVNDTYYIWQHIAVPTDGTGTFTVENDRKATDPNFVSYVQWWNDDLASADKWQQINAWEEMNKPWQGFILTTNSTTPGVTYSFTGNIIGNNDGQLHFNSTGYNFFGNSFTAPINVQTMLNGISNGEDIEMTVWIYSAEKLRYLESNNLMRLLGRAEFDQISSMQGFWLRNMTGEYGQDASVNYTNAVWNNPGAMGNPKVKAPAHRQAASEMGLSTAQIIVSNDSREDKLLLVEGSEYTERFDNGSDASKMMDENSFNIYAATTAGNLACVATDELVGTILSFKAIEAGEYTMTFENIIGEEYALYDMLTGRTIKMTEGDSFTFVAEAGLNEGRFMINRAPGSVTDMEKVQNTSAVKGVYNMLGQYVANTADWSKLSAGIYVVDGVKVIK